MTFSIESSASSASASESSESRGAPLAPAIAVRDLDFAYPGGGDVLKGVGLSIQRGERVGLVGPSGAGKSTLLMHLNGLLPSDLPTEAEARVFIEGIPLCRRTVFQIRRCVGFLFQDPDDQLICPTVGEDVAYGPLNLGLSQQDVVRRVRRSLEQVELAGYEYRSTLQLSLGERKRAALAGVLACEPAILALDEPFSSLDPRARRTLTRILERCGCTMVIATHELDFVVQLCPRVIVLDRGQVVADGPTRTVLGDSALMEQHGLEVPLTLRLAAHE
ncbi:MAG: ABC transporter ATP-binding protein [Planctomycetota bacterium]|nr:MAG: ABC transporter ATP-binding protein [Planctomycetota bacterium]